MTPVLLDSLKNILQGRNSVEPRKYFYDRNTGICDSAARQSKTVLHFDDYLKMILLLVFPCDDNSKGKMALVFANAEGNLTSKL